MEKIRFFDTPNVYDGEVSLDEKILVIKFNTLPNEEYLNKGIELLNEHNMLVQGDYTDYTTVYRTYEDNELLIEFSNDGSVYSEPIPVVTFVSEYGGTLDGITTQTVTKYEDLVIPTPTPNNNYEFVKWNPEIPESGVIEEDIVFTAEFSYIPIVKFIAGSNGTLDGDTTQNVKQYESLVIPTPVPDENYKFDKWFPEISEEGTIENDITFTAYFKSMPVVTFTAGSGGELNGTTTQYVDNYEDLVIPTPVANENYEFVEWSPEISDEGEIENNSYFTAIFKYIPTLEEIKTQKISEMSTACNTTITNGFDVDLSTGKEHFSLKVEDQLNLFGKQAQISQDVSTINEGKGYEYHQDGEYCKYYSLEDMLLIINTATAYKSYHTTYCNSLFRWIEQMNTKEDVNAVYYGIEIPEEYQSEVLKDYIVTMTE